VCEACEQMAAGTVCVSGWMPSVSAGSGYAKAQVQVCLGQREVGRRGGLRSREYNGMHKRVWEADNRGFKQQR